MFGETYLEQQDVIKDAFRTFLSSIDRPFFGILAIIYQIFFNVASSDIFSSGIITTFYARVQLIIGVFMMFQLAMTILKGIVNPDMITDSKNGVGNIIKRICISLILLALVVPINLSGGGNELEKQINNNGILFGTLYSLQYRILNNNTIGRLVLGASGNTGNYITSSDGQTIDTTDLETSSRVFTSSVLKTFYRINLLPKEQRETPPAGKTDDQDNNNRVCQDIPASVIKEYGRLDADPDTIIGFVNMTCLVDNNPISNFVDSIPVISSLAGNKVYMFAYTPVVSTITAILLVIIMLSFTIEVAKRAIKLAILRLIAPIPIIAYMNPKGSGDEALNSWTKSVTSTYLDLFIRLAIIYFIIFLIQEILINGLVINEAEGMVGAFSVVLIIIALFLFAKEAPKFLRQALGVKDDAGGSLFGGLKEAVGFVGGAGATTLGAIGSFNASRRASLLADEARGKDAKSLANRSKHLLAGIGGGILGAGTGAAAGFSAKDHAGSAAWKAMQQRNANTLSNGYQGSTILGRAEANASRLFGGEPSAVGTERELKRLDEQRKYADAVVKHADDKAKTTNWTTGSSSWTNQAGVTKTVTGNYQAWTFAKSAAEKQGADKFTFNGNEYTLEEANGLDFGFMKSNSTDYIQKLGVNPNDSTDIDHEFAKIVGDYQRNKRPSDPNVGKSTTRGDIKDVIANIDTQIDAKKKDYGIKKVNADASNKK